MSLFYLVFLSPWCICFRFSKKFLSVGSIMLILAVSEVRTSHNFFSCQDFTQIFFLSKYQLTLFFKAEYFVSDIIDQIQLIYNQN